MTLLRQLCRVVDYPSFRSPKLIGRGLLAWQQALRFAAPHFAAQIENQQPDAREDQADEADGSRHGPSGDKHHLNTEIHPDRPGAALQSCQQHQHNRQPDQVGAGDRRQPAVGRRDDGQREQHHDGFQDQCARHHPTEALPRVRPGRPVWLIAHSGSRPKSVRAAPAVTTDPVMTTPLPEKPSPPWPASSTSAVAVSMASGRLADAITRSGPNRSSARVARLSTSRARGEPLLVTMIWSKAGSSAARMPSTSFSAITETIPTTK